MAGLELRGQCVESGFGACFDVFGLQDPPPVRMGFGGS